MDWTSANLQNIMLQLKISKEAARIAIVGKNIGFSKGEVQ